jgi:hypothetical protein
MREGKRIGLNEHCYWTRLRLCVKMFLPFEPHCIKPSAKSVDLKMGSSIIVGLQMSRTPVAFFLPKIKDGRSWTRAEAVPGQL